MDKRHQANKESLKKTNPCLHEKPAKLRITTGCSPKRQETLPDKKCLHQQRVKHYLGCPRGMTKSVVPLQSQLDLGDREFSKLRFFQSNLSCSELPLSASEKTIKFVRSIDKKASKLAKGKKKMKFGKPNKDEFQRKNQEQCGITRRKAKATKDDYEILYLKTEQILKEYQKREWQWERQKNVLMEQLQDFRRKSMGMALTNCSTNSLHRRNFF